MYKERLELAKELLDSFKSNREIHDPFVMSFEYETIEALEYIIEQAERAQELESFIDRFINSLSDNCLKEHVRKYKRDKKFMRTIGRIQESPSYLSESDKYALINLTKIIETDERLVDKQYFKDIAEQALKEE